MSSLLWIPVFQVIPASSLFSSGFDRLCSPILTSMTLTTKYCSSNSWDIGNLSSSLFILGDCATCWIKSEVARLDYCAWVEIFNYSSAIHWPLSNTQREARLLREGFS
ncbi:hypothetical protein CPC08DRAFT_725770 [Agrocybe pediades]|nr:hypothetical protein CPC08DRAFT_725770 [Agrocybe pediades]